MLSIIITHYRTPALLKLCLKSIKESIQGIEYEVIVTDSQAEADNENFIKDIFPKVKLISFKENVGYSKSVNAGLKIAENEYILILNADILITDSKVVPAMIDFARQNPQTGLIGPKLLGFNNKVQDSCFRYPNLAMILARRSFLGKTQWGKKKLNLFLYRDTDLSQPKKVDWLQGSVMLTTKRAVDEVGPMDERFFMYLEDTDWCRRFWQKGYEVVYLPYGEMFHYHGRHSKRKNNFLLDAILNKYGWLHLVSLLKFLWKWRN